MDIQIEFTKDIVIPREGYNKQIKAGMKMICDKSYAEKFVKDGSAKVISTDMEKVFEEIRKTHKKAEE